MWNDANLHKILVSTEQRGLKSVCSLKVSIKHHPHLFFSFFPFFYYFLSSFLLFFKIFLGSGTKTFIKKREIQTKQETNQNRRGKKRNKLRKLQHRKNIEIELHSKRNQRKGSVDPLLGQHISEAIRFQESLI